MELCHGSVTLASGSRVGVGVCTAHVPEVGDDSSCRWCLDPGVRPSGGRLLVVVVVAAVGCWSVIVVGCCCGSWLLLQQLVVGRLL